MNLFISRQSCYRR